MRELETVIQDAVMTTVVLGRWSPGQRTWEEGTVHEKLWRHEAAESMSTRTVGGRDASVEMPKDTEVDSGGGGRHV